MEKPQLQSAHAPYIPKALAVLRIANLSKEHTTVNIFGDAEETPEGQLIVCDAGGPNFEKISYKSLCNSFQESPQILRSIHIHHSSSSFENKELVISRLIDGKWVSKTQPLHLFLDCMQFAQHMVTIRGLNIPLDGKTRISVTDVTTEPMTLIMEGGDREIDANNDFEAMFNNYSTGQGFIDSRFYYDVIQLSNPTNQPQYTNLVLHPQHLDTDVFGLVADSNQIISKSFNNAKYRNGDIVSIVKIAAPKPQLAEPITVNHFGKDSSLSLMHIKPRPPLTQFNDKIIQWDFEVAATKLQFETQTYRNYRIAPHTSVFFCIEKKKTN